MVKTTLFFLIFFLPGFVWSPDLGVLPGEEALLEAAVHGEGDEGDQPPVLQQSERGQEGVEERLLAPAELAGLLPVDVVQEHRHNDHGEHTQSYNATRDTYRWTDAKYCASTNV